LIMSPEKSFKNAGLIRDSDSVGGFAVFVSVSRKDQDLYSRSSMCIL
jgi:hypothetical protein